jgi:hypothetical protein
MVCIVVIGVLKSVGTVCSRLLSLPNPDSTHAIKLLPASAQKDSGRSERMLFAVSGGYKFTDQSFYGDSI